jgi:hypothetical protein
MNCQKCDQPTVGKSKYCSTHRAEARANFKAMCTDSKLASQERDAAFKKLINDLALTAEVAYTLCTPAPMAVYETAGLSDAPKPGGRSWYVSEGVCGFAWVVIKPATSSFAKYLARNNIGYKAYEGGWVLPMSYLVVNMSQSLERAEAASLAVAKELRSHDIKCYATSRMD